MKKSIIRLSLKVLIIFLLLISFTLLASANNQAPEILEKEVSEQNCNCNISIECSLNYDINLDDSARATIYVDILNSNEYALPLKSLLIRVKEVPGNITNVEVDSPFYGAYRVFSWDDVPGDDDERLLDILLGSVLGVRWVEKAKINKSDDGKTIHIFWVEKPENFEKTPKTFEYSPKVYKEWNGKKGKSKYSSAEITIDEKKEKATLETSDGRTINLIVKKENSKLNIYWGSYIERNCSSPVQCIQDIGRREYFHYEKQSRKTWDKYFYLSMIETLPPHAMTHYYVSYSTGNILRGPKDITKYLYVPPQGFDNVWVDIGEYKYWFSWDNVPGNDSEGLLRYLWDDLNFCLAENAEIQKSYDGKKIGIFNRHWFSWDNVPGNDSERLLRYLWDDLGLGWAEKPKINKSDDGKTIHIFCGEDSAEITINEKKEKATLKFSDGRTIDLKVKKENSKLNIYSDRRKLLAEIMLDEKKEKATLKFSDGRLLKLRVREKDGKIEIDRPCICQQTKNYNILINLPQDRYRYSQLKSIPHPYPDVTSVRGNAPTLSWHFAPNNRNSTRLIIPAYQIQKDKYMIALDTFGLFALSLGFISLLLAVKGYKHKWILICIAGVICGLIIRSFHSYFSDLISAYIDLF